MKKLILTLALAACSFGCTAEVESPDETTPLNKPSPAVQRLKVGSPTKATNNNIVIRNHPSGDLERTFTFEPRSEGYLHIDTPILYYTDCELANLVELLTFEKWDGDLHLDSEVLLANNRYQYVSPDYQYQLKVDFLNLGACKYINFNFSASFTVQETALTSAGAR